MKRLIFQLSLGLVFALPVALLSFALAQAHFADPTGTQPLEC